MATDTEQAALVVYRSSGLGIFGAITRWAGMPLEKIAIVMNSAQVSGSGQLRQALRIVFAEGLLAPYRVVGPASLVAWFMQYSVMGFVFQCCDTCLSRAFGVSRVAYGAELMEPAGERPRTADSTPAAPSSAGISASDAAVALVPLKLVLAPLLAGTLESVVANRAEVQRYYGIDKFAKIEAKLGWNALRRACGPALLANASRNFIMSSTSFIITPTAFKEFYPQESKSQQSLFWFGLGMNIFVGNSIAITQQALWGRALDYAAVDGGRGINYGAVVRHGLATEGLSAFYTPPKWFARVLMNAPAQGTLPFFYNQVLPRGEHAVLGAVSSLQRMLSGVGANADSPTTQEA